MRGGSGAWRLFPLWRQLYEHGSVPRHLARELGLERAQVFLAPQIADRLRAADPQFAPLHTDGHRHLVAIEQTDRERAVGEWTRPHLELVVLGDAIGRLAQGILVHRE